MHKRNTAVSKKGKALPVLKKLKAVDAKKKYCCQ
jgi:hypothetical protein